MIQFLTGIFRFFMGWLVTFVGTIMAVIMTMIIAVEFVPMYLRTRSEVMVNDPVRNMIIASVAFLGGGFVSYLVSERYVTRRKLGIAFFIRGAVLVVGTYLAAFVSSCIMALFGTPDMVFRRTQGGELFTVESTVESFSRGLSQSVGVIIFTSLILYWIAGRVYSRQQASTPSPD